MEAINPQPSYSYRAVQREAFSLAGLLANVSVQNLSELVIKTVSDAVLRQVREGNEDLSGVTTRGQELPRQNRVSPLPVGLYATVRAREASLSTAITSLNECRLNVISVLNEPHLNVISSSNEDFNYITTRAEELTISKMASGIIGEVSTRAEGFSDISTVSNEGFSYITTRGREGFLVVTTREENFNYLITYDSKGLITVTTRGKTNSVPRQFDNSGKKQAQRYFGTSTHKAEIEFCESIKRDCSGFLEQYARAREGSCQIDQEPHIVKSYGYHVINQVLGSGQSEFLESIKKEHREFRAQYAHVWLYGYAEFSDTLVQVFCESIKKECAKKNLPLFRFTVYGNSAPAKSGAGIGLSDCLSAIHDAPSVFFCVVRIAQPFFGSAVIIRAAYQVMVGCSGAEKSAPVSDNAGKTNSVQSTTSKIGLFGGGISTQLSEAAIWLPTLPKNHLLSGAFTLASNHAISLLPLALNPKPDLCYPIAHVCLLLASVQEAHMLNQFTVLGYGTNQRGLTIGINYKITSDSTAKATAHAMLQAQRDGLTRIRITRVMGATA